jgi:hypothetical protein
LFSDYDLRGTLDNQLQAIQKEVDATDDDRLLNTSVDDMVTYLLDKYRIDPITLDESAISVDQAETEIDVSGDQGRFIRDRSQPFYIKGTSNKFFVPFSGDQSLFKCRPSTFTHSPPVATIEGGELVLTYNTTEHNAEGIRSRFDRDLQEIKRYLEWIAKDVQSHSSSLGNRIRQTVESRREKILANRGLASSLGFPMRERSGVSKTYSVPNVRRKPPIRPPAATTKPYKPEPALDEKEYEHILLVIDNMVLVMERSPHAFAGMEEEDIRQHFLVQLNGHYEGQATGETFNYEGKTDILIRAEGKNIFIAECKFWRGPKGFTDTIDQILGYTSWRDTKAAILVFNRNKNLSSVLEKIPALCEGHANFKRFLENNRESGWRVVFSHKDDPDRELTMQINVYDVPVESQT